MQYSLLKSRKYDVSCGSDGDGSDIRGYYGADNPRGLSLGANVLQAVLSETMVVEITATGGVILLGIGLLMLEVKQVKVTNFLPELVVAPLLVALWEQCGVGL